MRQNMDRQRTDRQRTDRQGEDLELIDISRAGNGRQKASRSGYRNRTAEEVRIRRRRRKRRRQKKVLHILLLLILTGLLALFLFLLLRNITGKNVTESTWKLQEIINGSRPEKPEITEEFLTPNPYSRPQTKLKKVKNIFVH